MASISKYKSKAGVRWRAQFTKPDGTRGSKRGFATKTEAADWVAKHDASKSTGEWVDPARGRVKLSEIGTRWLATQKPPRLKASTYRVTESTWRMHVLPKWGKRQVASIRKSEISEWLSGIEAGPSTKRRAHLCLSQILAMAVDDGCIARNPAAGVKLPPKAAPRKVYLSLAQVQRLADEVEEHHRVKVWVLATVGLRWSELAGLQVGDIDLEQRRIHIQRGAVTIEAHEGRKREVVVDSPKSYTSRKVAVPSFVCDMLEPLVQDRRADEWVWTRRGGGGPMVKLNTDGWYNTALLRLRAPETKEKARAEARLPESRRKSLEDERFPWVTPHGLRHVAASLMVRSGASVLTIQRQLGHTSAAMTLDEYADLFDGDLDVVADAMEQMHREMLIEPEKKRSEPNLSHEDPEAA